MKNCPICSLPIGQPSIRDYGDKQTIDCGRCGIFEISRTALASTANRDQTKAHLVSHYIRKKYDSGEKVFLGSSDFKKLSNLPEIPLTEKTSILLESYAKDASSYSDKIEVDNPKYIARIAAKHEQEYHFVIGILYEQGLLNAITRQALNSNINPYCDCNISASGWATIEEFQKLTKSKQGFVAMWFNDEVNSAWSDAIEPAIMKAGFEALRIDKKEHNEKIDDEIIAEIQRSRFIVADFTGHRGGVYFEAGYALGRGIPVIWTCHEDHLKDLHFDVRQYNTIVWQTNDELKEKLFQRIRATIPRE